LAASGIFAVVAFLLVVVLEARAALVVFVVVDFFAVFDVAFEDFLVVAMRLTISHLVSIPPLKGYIIQTMSNQATFGGGCFWCLDALFRRINGVQSVVSGYSGGHVANPTYDEVCTGSTGHAEVVQITFDQETITYHELLEIFFTMHDPTTVNRQGNDVGEQYRSIILYHDEQQAEIAKDVIKHFATDLWQDPIVTQVLPLIAFYPAEDYHQDYFNKNPTQGYCMMIINPKVQKLRQKFASKLKP
jgi:peptide-methionine (S)-S-oxide reductase